MPTSVALNKAKEEGLDLVEVSPNSKPPVAKILDWGKYRYEQQKSRAKQKVIEVKGIRLGIKIGEHDLDTKLRLAEKFLEKRNKVRFQLRFKGREIVHKDLGVSLMEKVTERLSDIAEMEQKPEFTGRDMITIFAPIANKTKKMEEKGASNAEN